MAYFQSLVLVVLPKDRASQYVLLDIQGNTMRSGDHKLLY